MKTSACASTILATVLALAGLVLGWTSLRAAVSPSSYQLTDVITGGSGNNAARGPSTS